MRVRERVRLSGNHRGPTLRCFLRSNGVPCGKNLCCARGGDGALNLTLLGSLRGGALSGFLPGQRGPLNQVRSRGGSRG